MHNLSLSGSVVSSEAFYRRLAGLALRCPASFTGGWLTEFNDVYSGGCHLTKATLSQYHSTLRCAVGILLLSFASLAGSQVVTSYQTMYKISTRKLYTIEEKVKMKKKRKIVQGKELKVIDRKIDQ